jgi:primosomal protein N' (replication factor Y) (superfamily II helicase)
MPRRFARPWTRTRPRDPGVLSWPHGPVPVTAAARTLEAAPPPETAGPPWPGGTVAEVVFPVPVDHGFDYYVPAALLRSVQPGHRVWAEFGKRGAQMGVVLRLKPPAPDGPPLSLKPLGALVDPEPALSVPDLELARWLADRYLCPLGEAVFGVLPVGKQTAPLRPRTVLPRTAEPASAPVLTAEQRAARDQILPSIEAGQAAAFLLFGVAAAGKTEVYLQAIDAALRAGRSALYLVPEIGLTPQAEAILRSRFRGQLEVWHSEIARGPRWQIWQKALSGESRVILGARSALFLPLRNLGVIIVDEEHDSSYKEDSRPRYHARDVALKKAQLHNATVVLGSATPSMESYQRALDGSLSLVEMTQRVEERPFPQVTVVDARRLRNAVLTEPLVKALGDTLARKEQAILFLNRRGFATYVACRDCRWEARCPKCGVSLVYHKANAKVLQEPGQGPDPASEGLRCHTCDHQASLSEQCPDCRGPTVRLKGRGTQRLVDEVKFYFPEARVLRWDRDTTRRRGAHQEAFAAVQSQAVDVVVGTQMVAHGLDFPRVTFVGVVDADQSLRFPDFRAGEYTFQLLTQVAGRSGRADKPGLVYIQTRHPDHYAVHAASRFDYRTFADAELRFRQEMRYPPFIHLIQLVVHGAKPDRVEKAAEDLVRWLEHQSFPSGTDILGPAPAFHALRAGHTQWQVLVKTSAASLGAVIAALRKYAPPASVSFLADVDPQEMR